jgi:hypothetical protein
MTMLESYAQTCFLLMAESPRGARFLAGPITVVDEPSAAWRFLSQAEAARHLDMARQAARDCQWRVVRAELGTTLHAV